MKKLLVAVIPCFLLSFAQSILYPVYAQAPQNWTSADMYLAIRKMNVLGTVLYLAAHPDDENTRLIAYFCKDKMYRTGYLSMTRGDGGQNLIGNEQGIDLGLIRTQELLSARRLDGGEQFFTRAFDFGYSKNPEETFTKWDKEKILSDVVWVIRKFQPDVIITRFPTTGEGGHGHHTASAILANEAFNAAADASRFPEQLKYVKTWQVKRILWNTFNFGSTNTTSNDQFKLDVGGYNPLLGKSYGEIAATSRSQHKSQGFGVPSSRGEAIEFFKTTEGEAPSTDLMDGVDPSWNRVNGGAGISKIVDSIASAFDLLHPEKSVPSLVKLYQAIGLLPDGYWKTQKLKEAQQLIEQCSGLFLDATSPEQFAVQTDSIRINFSFNNRLGVAASLKQVSVDAFDSTFDQALSRNKNMNFGKTFYVPATKPVTQPYWLANKMEEGYFNVTDQQLIGQPDVQPSYTADILLNIGGQEFHFIKPVKYKFTDPVKGELYEPLVVIPRIFLRANPEVAVSGPKNRDSINYELSLSSNRKANNIVLRVNNSKDTLFNGTLSKNENKNFEGNPVAVDINPKSKGSAVSITTVIDTTFFSYEDNTWAYDSKNIKYDHIPYISYLKKTQVVRKFFNYETFNKKIGYIVGAGDKVPEALEQMGYDVTLLGEKELSRNNLKQFDAIITGVRAYNTDEWLNTYYEKLMKYVNDGGNLIVQYNTSTNIGPIRAKMGPYNFDISRTRVTDENAEITFLRPDHPVLNYPNKITDADFKGWVQERSLYHASAWDKSNFETILSMHDPGESADEGSLIISKYGKGVFVYTGLVFFRELPAGVPGAYRLMANIIALNKKKAF